MIVASIEPKRPTMGESYTYEDFYKFLGTNPKKFGVVSKMQTNLTASFLTEALGNIYYNGQKKSNQFLAIDSMVFEWNIETNQIKRIAFADDVTEDGANGSDITMAFQERYYEKYDIFKIEATEQQCQVITRPVRKGDGYWEVQVRIVDNTFDTVLDLDGCRRGMTTRFISNAHPEYSEEGYTKTQTSTEKHRNYITYFRNDISYSSQYKMMEKTFIKIAEGKGENATKETIYAMDPTEKILLDNFMLSRNQGLLFNKSSIDPVTGRSTIYEPDGNRPIYIGEGLIPQIERFASKYAYTTKPTRAMFDTVISTLTQKDGELEGRHITFLCNLKFWSDLQSTLGDYLKSCATDGAFMYSKSKGDYYSVGATFNSYQYAGNFINFKVDLTLTREYGNDKGFAVAIDLTADKAANKPAVAMFTTVEGGQCMNNKYIGVGGEDGHSSGNVASPVAGSKLIMSGYAGIAVFNPYRSFIIRQA